MNNIIILLLKNYKIFNKNIKFFIKNYKKNTSIDVFYFLIIEYLLKILNLLLKIKKKSKIINFIFHKYNIPILLIFISI